MQKSVAGPILGERQTMNNCRFIFAGQMSHLNYQQKETLIAIAKAGKATGVTSAAFVKKCLARSAL